MAKLYPVVNIHVNNPTHLHTQGCNLKSINLTLIKSLTPKNENPANQ